MLMKRAVLALTFIFALMFFLLTGAKAVSYNYGEFEGLPYSPPIVDILSPFPDRTYNVPEIPLNVTVQIRRNVYHNMEQMRWLNYSLDGQTAVPLTLTIPSMSQLPYPVYGNCMLTGLADGNHNLVIYGETYVGGLNGYFNETVSFTVDTSNTPEPEPFPTALVIASVIAVIVVFAVFLAYMRKHKQ
jgi:hypothetical protein